MKPKNCLILFIAIVMIFTVRCKKNIGIEELFPPVLSTTQVTKITTTSAISGGQITDEGIAAVIDRGVVWDTSENPIVESSEGRTSDGHGTGSFVSILNNLSPNTKYYVRAYAINDFSIGYGNKVSFTSLPTFSLNILSGVIGAWHYTDHIYVQDENGYLFYSDNGIIWYKKNVLDFSSTGFLQKDDLVIGLSYDKLYLSYNNGTSWSNICQEGNYLNNFGFSGINSIDIFDNTIYASTVWGGVWVFKNNEWVKILSTPENDGIESIAIDQDGIIYVCTYLFKVLKSSDNGISWSQTGDFEFPSSPDNLYIDNYNNVFVGTYWNGIFQYKNNQWYSLSTGLPEGRGVTNIVKSRGILFALIQDQLGTQGIYFSSDNGGSWGNANFNLSNTEYTKISQLVANKQDAVIVNIDFNNFYRFDFDNRIWLKE